MPRTRQDLIELVLQNLGVLAAGQSAAAEDRQTVNARVDPKLSELGRREVFVGLNADSLDDAVFLYVADILTFACATPFGISGAKRTELAQVAAEAEAMLKGMARQFSTTAAADGFDIVRTVLETLGVVTVGQDPSAQDRGVVSARIASMLADLRAREITTLTNVDDAEVAQKRHLANILTAVCAPAFGITGAARDQFTSVAEGAERLLNVMARQFDTGVATNGTFDLVQVTLENLGAVAVGRTASDKDRSIITGRVGAVLADLRNREVISIASAADADASTLLQLSVILTSACAMAWGLPADVRRALKEEALLAEAALQRQTRQLDSSTGTSGTFDLAQTVLEMLGVVAAGQTATAKDRSVITARVAVLLADLRNRELIDLPSIATVDDSTKLHLAALLAARCARLFGIPDAMLQGLKAEVADAEASLRLMARQLDTGTATSGEFDLVQNVLEQCGVVTGGQTGSDQDRTVVEARIPVLLAELRRREIITLASIDVADEGTLLPLSTLLAGKCAALLDAPDAVVQALKGERQDAETALRRIARQIDTGSAVSGTFDIVQSVLETLQVVEAGQTASTNDRAVVSARIAPVLADLKQREIIAIPSIASADAATQLHVAAILALACAVPFGVPADPFREPAGRAEVSLRTMSRQFDGGIATSGTFDVVQAVLESLGVVVAGYTGSAKDRAVVSARIAPTLADLRLREIVNIASIATADDAVLIHLATILTSACSQAFGIGVETRTLLAGEAKRAEAALKALARQLDVGTATSSVFDPVQVVLEMLGIVAAGQTATDKDRAVITARVQPKLLELYSRDICGVPDISLLAPELQSAFAQCLAADCALSFSEMAPARVAMLAAMVPAAEQRLRYASFVYDVRPALRTEAFWGRRCGYAV
ncbi:hypothetical protein FPV16_14950 [Methylobacterium sp. W2]|uniref:hypothetical protein n=1 Tax=Methylobacterium sp. W2 TaxID=2598107 RepID=UPI001D0C235C|nr:hypothetical protein [Methylobacterium sp. W2]MCC0807512.1 hypothetical protein [Methylobacterium sp. W2]